MSELRIERALPSDAEELLKIYSHYVLNTAVSFEYEVPSVEEFEGRIRNISAKYPYIKAIVDGQIVGYAYAAAFKSRAAYDYAVETTIYLRKDMKRCGIGRALYETLERSLRGMGIQNMNACIAKPDVEDEYLTMDSVRFHARMGFESVGVFTKVGYKFDRWYNMTWMEKMIGEHEMPAAPVRFGEWTI